MGVRNCGSAFEMLERIVRLQISPASKRNGALFAGVLPFVGVLAQMLTQRGLSKGFAAQWTWQLRGGVFVVGRVVVHDLVVDEIGLERCAIEILV